MNKSKAAWFLVATAVLLVVSFAGSAFAGPATEAIQQTHEAVLLVLHDKELSRPERTAERQHELIRVIGQRFNYRAMGRHILGLQWPLLRDDERAEFIELFRLLLLKTYAHYLDG